MIKLQYAYVNTVAFYTLISISLISVHCHILWGARCLPVRVILANSTVVTRSRKDDKCGLFILQFYSKLKAFIHAHVGTSNSTQESPSSKVNICLATQDIRILRNAFTDSRVGNSSPRASMPIHMNPLQTFPLHFLIYI